ncbi:unnamed protein product [Blepharisma stoltei]|uniref:Serine/threonine-protein kinase PLK n=1 Tax=Blepharisma stoltei TaxID=1481888 RepID=A0AAU9KLG9_9CILI|nr:unnamed protein product [Blepharisma stoltei]
MSSRTRRSSIDSQEQQIIEEKIAKVNGEISVKSYSKGKFLGKGGFARVYELLCLDTKQLTAAKLITKESLSKARARQKLMSEIKIHRALHHPNIVHFEHFFEDGENVYILLELCANQTLSELMRRRKRLTEIEAQCYLQQTISALKYLHCHRVIHRDIKLGNLFLTDKMELKLGDFGLATKLEHDGERKRTICGTPNYIAPEILDGKQGHSYEVDIWSLGVLAYTLLVGKPPFETADVKTTYRRIKMNAYNFPDHVPVSDEAKALISSILINDPLKRPSLDDILESPFFTKNSFPKLLPASTLAVPPSSSYLRQFEQTAPQLTRTATEDSSTSKHSRRTSSQTNLEIATLTKGISRGSSRDRESAPNTNEKKIASSSSYIPPENGEGPKIWVKRWVDYSSKYGLGYLLSNYCTGVYFNDSTKIIADPCGSYFQYIHRPQTAKSEEVSLHSFKDYPSDLQKKVTLLLHFRKHLIDDDTIQETKMSHPLTYVKKWLATSHGIIFRLSNKIVQVSFQDKTELLLCSESKIVSYVSKKGERNTYPLSSAMDCANSEMVRRLRYTKEVLTSMLQPRCAGTGEYRPKTTERDL